MKAGTSIHNWFSISGMPVRVVAHDVETAYLGLGVLAVIPHRMEAGESREP